MNKAIWGKTSIQFVHAGILICSLAGQREFLPLNSARAGFGTRSGENKRRAALPSAAVPWEHVACVLSHSARVPLAVPADARAAGVLGTAQPAFVPVHPCPARIGAWDASQMKTQAASPVLPSSQKGCSVMQRGGPAAQAVEHLICHSSLKGFGSVKETPSTFCLQTSENHLF